MTKSLVFKLLAFGLVVVAATTNAFTTTYRMSRNPLREEKAPVTSFQIAVGKRNLKPMFANKEPYTGGNYGLGRGLLLQAIVVAVCAWLFTIPPEFRRAHICPEEQTQTCVTPSAWVAGITEYYRNGGGIKWDFSIDPATLKENQEMLNQLQKK